MARNLATHRSSHPAGSPPLLVYNRSLDKCEQLQKELGPNKVRIAQSYRQIAEECDIIITSLANDTVVKSVYEEFSTALKVCPTIQLEYMQVLRGMDLSPGNASILEKDIR